MKFEKAKENMEKFDFDKWMATLDNLRDELRKQADFLYGIGEYDHFEELDESVSHLSVVIRHFENVKGDE